MAERITEAELRALAAGLRPAPHPEQRPLQSIRIPIETVQRLVAEVRRLRELIAPYGEGSIASPRHDSRRVDGALRLEAEAIRAEGQDHGGE